MSQGCGEGQMRHPLGPGVQGLPVAGPEVGGTELLTGPLKADCALTHLCSQWHQSRQTKVRAAQCPPGREWRNKCRVSP